ncbi:MAG: hypothetical protein KIT09_32055 [Bryobacteraceae bacterium]|nr:hypothetical protein [Bryobacteraceae bacterium]
MSFEVVLFLIVFLLLPLLQHLLRSARQPDEPVHEPPVRVGPRPAYRPVPAARTAPPRPESAAQAGKPPATAVPQHRRRRAPFELRDRRSLRRAIALMTILGPCRANQPSGH